MKILLTHRYFWPDTPPYGAMLRRIAADLAGAGHDVEVFTSRPSYGRGITAPGRETVDGFRVRRCFVFAENKKNPFVSVVLDPAVPIDQVKIWNRKGFESRVNGATVVFKDGKKSLASLKIAVKGGDSSGGGDSPFDEWIAAPFRTAEAHLNNESIEEEVVVKVPSHLKGADAKRFVEGAEIYAREGHCATCHQPDGNGTSLA